MLSQKNTQESLKSTCSRIFCCCSEAKLRVGLLKVLKNILFQFSSLNLQLESGYFQFMIVHDILFKNEKSGYADKLNWIQDQPTWNFLSLDVLEISNLLF